MNIEFLKTLTAYQNKVRAKMAASADAYPSDLPFNERAIYEMLNDVMNEQARIRDLFEGK